MTAGDITAGTKNAALKYFLQYAALLISSADPGAPRHCSGTIISTNFTVFPNDCINSSSLNGRAEKTPPQALVQAHQQGHNADTDRQRYGKAEKRKLRLLSYFSAFLGISVLSELGLCLE